jgi:hypothetical protein
MQYTWSVAQQAVLTLLWLRSGRVYEGFKPQIARGRAPLALVALEGERIA